jgi:hypothetical protein
LTIVPHDKASIITSQLPIEHWHAWIGDATVVDAILDRGSLRRNGQKLPGGRKISTERPPSLEFNRVTPTAAQRRDGPERSVRSPEYAPGRPHRQ